MKRLILILTVLAFSVSLRAQNGETAQGYNKRGDRDEVRVGWSISPAYFLSEFYGPHYFSIGYTLGDAYRDIVSEAHSAGVFSVEYSHFFKNWISVCADFGYTPLWNYKTNAFGVKLPSDKGFMFHVLPKVRFSYLRANLVSLYSDIGLGLAIGSSAGKVEFNALFHTTLLGVTVGKRVYGFAESNLSMKNIGFTVGAGYRF